MQCEALIICLRSSRKEGLAMNGQAYKFYLRHLVSITICPNGVRNTLTDELVTHTPSTIVETMSTAYVVDYIIHLSGSTSFTIDGEHIPPEDAKKKAKKSDYRAHKRSEGGYILINKDHIISELFSPTGAVNQITGVTFDGLTTIIETPTKTFLVSDIIHSDGADKFLTIPLSSIKDVTPSKKADYVLK